MYFCCESSFQISNYCHRIGNSASAQFPSNFEDSLLFRVGALSLPFLSLYNPFQKGIDAASGSFKIVSRSRELYSGERNLSRMKQLALSVCCVVSLIFHSQFGSVVRTFDHLLGNVWELGQATVDFQMEKFLALSLSSSHNICYLSTLFTGSLTLGFVLGLLSVLKTFYTSYKEREKERYLESGAKALLATIYLHRAKGKYDHIPSAKRLGSVQEVPKISKVVKRVVDQSVASR